MIHCGVRWKMARCATCSAMVGAIWNPVAPAPTSAKRAPVMSRPAGQRAEWNEGPSNESMPGICGILGRFKEPTALMTKRACSVSSAPSEDRTRTAQRSPSSSHLASSTSVLKRQWLPQFVLAQHALEIRTQLGLLAEILAPVVGGLEGIAVVVTADIDPRARIAVLPPGAARSRVLLDDRERETGLRQADACDNAGLSGPDHQHRGGGPNVLGDLVTPCDRSGIDAVELKLLREHPPQQAINRLTRHERHQLGDQVVRERMGHTSAVTKGRDGGDRQSAALRRTRPPTCPPWKSPGMAYVGRWGPRTQAGSPVICTSEHKSVGILTSARAAAIAASSSEKGWPAYGLRGRCVTPASMPLPDGLRRVDAARTGFQISTSS